MLDAEPLIPAMALMALPVVLGIPSDMVMPLIPVSFIMPVSFIPLSIIMPLFIIPLSFIPLPIMLLLPVAMAMEPPAVVDASPLHAMVTGGAVGDIMGTMEPVADDSASAAGIMAASALTMIEKRILKDSKG